MAQLFERLQSDRSGRTLEAVNFTKYRFDELSVRRGFLPAGQAIGKYDQPLTCFDTKAFQQALLQRSAIQAHVGSEPKTTGQGLEFEADRMQVARGQIHLASTGHVVLARLVD